MLLRSAEHFHAKFIVADPMTEPNGWLSTANFNLALRESVELLVQFSHEEAKCAADWFSWAFWLEADKELVEKGRLSAVKSPPADPEQPKRFRASRPRRPGQEDDGRLWDPAEVKSRPVREVLRQLQEWAPLRVPVLFVGERGTGKTTMAHFLRSVSPYQKDGKEDWPVVVCGQFRVNPQLARSELFGHKKGAFTGATSDRKGLLEEADGDTLFLDEIADIDSDTQRLLMAAVEGRGFQRLGDSQTRHSSFRLVCATNRPLSKLQDEVLDRDFFDRVATFVLEVPPLRRCREDLPLFWRRVLKRATVISGIAPDGRQHYAGHSDLLEALACHPLPGNFRDLQRAAYHLLAALHADRPESEVIAAALDSLEDAKPDALYSTLRAPSESLPVIRKNSSGAEAGGKLVRC